MAHQPYRPGVRWPASVAAQTASGGCETRRTVVRQPGPEPRFWCARDAVTRLRGGSLGVPVGVGRVASLASAGI